jgi:hypothetical protein
MRSKPCYNRLKSVWIDKKIQASPNLSGVQSKEKNSGIECLNYINNVAPYPDTA